MDDPAKTRLRTYAWSYFAFHADQRMKTFHFYILIILASLGGIISIHNSSNSLTQTWPIGLFICLISIAFAFLDKRNRILIKNAEAALIYLDAQEKHQGVDNKPHPLEIFAFDNHATSVKIKLPIIEKHISYTDILRLIFWSLGLGGFTLFAAVLTMR